MPLLDDLIKKFSETTIAFPKSQELEFAIAKAHTDMSKRANGHKPAIQTESVSWLKKRFLSDSPFKYTSLPDFNNWHHTTCVDYCNHMNSKGFDFLMTYGRAQKILNMTFKYLYCTSAYKALVEKIIPFLHMTLDGYTLRWYKEVVVKYFNDNRDYGITKLKVGDVSDWSKMNEIGKHQYIDIQSRIREYLKTAINYHYSINTAMIEEIQPYQKNNTINIDIPFDPTRKHPFFAEFIVWEGEIVRSKAENLFKGLNGLYETWNDDKWAVNAAIQLELKSKLTTILKNI
ncbi:MAG: hypothetical protein IJF05_04150 [Clostridia bacterium]|nr:hypothetical protein [Clostridia bacterium]